MTGGGYALKLRLQAALTGTCMRCLKVASPQVEWRRVRSTGKARARSWKVLMWTARSSTWQRGREMPFVLAAPVEGAV